MCRLPVGRIGKVDLRKSALYVLELPLALSEVVRMVEVLERLEFVEANSGSVAPFIERIASVHSRKNLGSGASRLERHDKKSWLGRSHGG